MKDCDELIKKIEEDIKIALSTPSEIHENYIRDEVEVSQIMSRITNYATNVMSDDPQKGGGLLTLAAKVSPFPLARLPSDNLRRGHYEVI